MDARPNRPPAWPVVPALLLAGLSACTGTPSQVLVVVDSDLEIPSELQAIRVVLRDEAGAELRDHRFALTTGGLPISFGVGPKDGDAEVPLWIELEARGELDQILFVRRAHVRFVANKSLVLPVFLAASCRTTSCGEGLTCTERGCASPEIDPGSLCDSASDRCAGPSAPADGGADPDAGLAPDVSTAADAGADAGFEPDATADDAEPGDATADDLGAADAGGPADAAAPDAEEGQDVAAPDADAPDAAAPDAAAPDSGPSGPVNTGVVRITGVPQENEQLTASTGTWQGNGNVAVTLRWQRCGTGGDCFDIPSLTGTTYLTSGLDADTRLQIIVTARDASGTTMVTSPLFGPIRRTGRGSLSWLTGFEVGAAHALVEGSQDNLQGATIDGNAGRSGQYGLRVSSPMPGASFTKLLDQASFAGAVVSRFAVRLSTLPSVGTVVVPLAAAAADRGAYVGLDLATSRFVAVVDSVRSMPSTVPVVAGRWYLIDVRVTSGPPSTLEWRVDGLVQATVTVPQLLLLPGFGLGAVGSEDPVVAHFDDWAVSLIAGDYPIGDGQTIGLRPNASGPHQSPGACTMSTGQVVTQVENFSWALLTDWPVNESNLPAAGWVRCQQNNIPAILDYHHEDLSGIALGPRAVRPIFALRSTGGMSNQGTALTISSDGFSSTVASGIFLEPTVRYFSRTFPAAPARVPWTVQTVNDLRTRLETGIDPTNAGVQLEAILVEVELGR